MEGETPAPSNRLSQRFPSARCFTDSYPKCIVDLTPAVTLLPTMRRMERYSLEEPPREEHDEEGTPADRRAGIAIALVGALMMALSVLDGWSP